MADGEGGTGAPRTGAPLIVVAPDKYRGTATAAEAAAAMAGALEAVGFATEKIPLSDGGEGLLEVFGGPNQLLEVLGPNGAPVSAAWRFDGDLAVVETARASGLLLAGGAGANDPVAASTAGTGELIAAAITAGARRIVVGAGGSATTDGGAGAIARLEHLAPLGGPGRDFEVVVACDVSTLFADAAERFAPQKGASPTEVRLLRRRLEHMATELELRFCVDVSRLSGSGAAGGLAGGLAALGALLVPGFALVAELVQLDRRISRSRLVVTGEGRVDAASLEGKVVGGVIGTARRAGVPVAVVAGSIEPGVLAGIAAVDLTAEHGEELALTRTTDCLAESMGLIAHLAR